MEDCETVPASDLALTEAGRQIDALGPGVQVGVWSPSPTPVAEPRAGAVPVASRRLVLVSDARAIMDMVLETQHDSDSETNSQLRTTAASHSRVVVALADPGASRHVMGDAVVANSGRFHVLSSGVDEEHLIPATSSTVPASSGALRNVAPRVHTQFVESPLSTGRDSSVVEGSAIPATRSREVLRGIYREM